MVKKSFGLIGNYLRFIKDKSGKGSYRIYIPITRKYGIKFARLDFNAVNTILGFLTGIIMNVLERKRYKRSVLKYSYGYKYEPTFYSLCPTYFTCGLFNIVRYAEPCPDDWWEIDKTEICKGYKASPFTESPDKDSSFGLVEGKLVDVDYGDFTIYANRSDSVKELDYK